MPVKLPRYALALVILIILVFGILYSAGLWDRGYHFSDLTSVYHHHLMTSGQGLWETLSERVRYKWEVQRLNPVYHIHEVLLTWWLGADFGLWAKYYAAMCVLTGLFLYGFGRLFGFSFLGSLFLSLLVICGQQMKVFWISDFPEGLGMLWLSLALFLSLLPYRYPRLRLWSDLAFVLSMFLTSLVKESYAVLMPGFILFRIILDRYKGSGAWMETLRRQAVVIFVLGALFVAELLIILVVVGTGGTGYAGWYGFRWIPFFEAFRDLAIYSNGTLVLLGVVMLFVFLRQSGPVLKELRRAGPLLFALLSVIVVASLIYLKSGVAPRYIFPTNILFSFVIVYLFERLRDISRDHGSFLRFLFATVTIATLGFRVFLAQQSAEAYGEDIRSTRVLMEYVEKRVPSGGPVMIAGEIVLHFEALRGFKQYLEYIFGYDDAYIFATVQKSPEPYYEGFAHTLVVKAAKDYKGKIIRMNDEIRRMKTLVVLPEVHGAFFKVLTSEPWFHPAHYSRHVVGERYIIYEHVDPAVSG